MSADGSEDASPIGGWVNTKAAAASLGVVPRTLYGLIDRGELPAYRFGRVIRLRADDVTTFIDSRRIQPGARNMGRLAHEYEQVAANAQPWWKRLRDQTESEPVSKA